MVHDRKFAFRRMVWKGSGQPADVAVVVLVHILIGVQAHLRHLLEKNTSRDGTLVVLQEFLHGEVGELQLLKVELFRSCRHVARFKGVGLPSLAKIIRPDAEAINGRWSQELLALSKFLIQLLVGPA